MSQDPVKPRGRPPSQAARNRALSAAYDILMSEGFGRLSIEAVAARSGVGKPTIYRNWSNASELAMAALMQWLDDPPEAATASLSAVLTHQMRAIVTAFATTRGRQITLALASADPESEMTRAFRNRVILSGREAGRALIARSVHAGEIAAPKDIEVILDMLYAPIFYRLLVGHLPLDTSFADGLVASAITLLQRPAS